MCVLYLEGRGGEGDWQSLKSKMARVSIRRSNGSNESVRETVSSASGKKGLTMKSLPHREKTRKRLQRDVD